MSNAALAFLAGLGGGYMTEKNRQEDKARLDKKDQREQDEHDARMEEVKRKRDSERAIREAAQPQAVTPGAVVQGVAAQPTVYDDASVASSDVRQARRLSELPAAAEGGIPAPATPAATMTPAPVVGGKAFPDAASADAAAAAANTPQAVRQRQVAAMRGFDPERADRMEASGIQIDTAKQTEADAAWRRKVAGAMVNGGHEGLAELVNATEHGPAQGVKLKAVVSPDGKSVTYAKVGADGKLTPTGLTFTNDGDGIARAAAALDGAISPADRVKMAQADAKLALEKTKEVREGKETDAKATLYGAQADAYKALGRERDAKADGGGKVDHKLDEDDKIRLTTANTRVRDAEKMYGEALGKLMPGDKPETSEAVKFAAQQLKAAKLDHLRTNIELGQIKPDAMANQILGVAKNPQEVLKSLTELASVGGAEYSDQVAALVQQSDAWKAMNPQAKAKPTATGAKPAAAAGMGAGPTPKQDEMKPAPEVTAGGFPRDPNARASKARVAAAVSQGIQPPREQLVKDATTAAAAAKNAADAYRVADMPGFQFLPPAEQIRIANLAKGQ